MATLYALPEHLHTELRDLAGISEHPMSKKFPLGIVEKERMKTLWS